MGRKSQILLILLLFSLSIGAKEEWNLSLGWNTSFIQGQIDELVLASHEGEVYTLSHLFWDVDQLWAGGPHAELSNGPWSISLDVLWNWNMGSGMMVDYDWKGYRKPAYGVGVSFDEWTDRSYHNVEILQFMDFGLKGQWSTADSRKLGGIFSAGINYIHFYWEDDPLTFIHSKSAYRDTSGTYSVDTAITFDFSAIELELGLEGWVELLEDTYLHAGGTISPLGSRETVDHHLTSNAEYIDEFYFPVGASLSGSLKRTWAEHFLTEFSAGYCWFLFSQGTTTENTYPEGEYEGTFTGGAGSYGGYLQINFLVGYQF